MNPSYLAGRLVADRHTELRQQAAAARLAREARDAARPAAAHRPIRRRGLLRLVVRPVSR